jgi:hypothetical protein
MPKSILVFGWYGVQHGNLGDELFRSAFQRLFPDYQFRFVDRIIRTDLNDIDVVIFGGGSFLDNALPIDDDAKSLLATKKLLYIGIGMETDIHPDHRKLLAQAELVATRTQGVADTLFIPDLVYALQEPVYQAGSTEKTILVLPNCSVIATWQDPVWKKIWWDSFKLEFAQVLEQYYRDGYQVDFFPMCQCASSDDHLASMELLGYTEKRKLQGLLSQTEPDIGKLISLFSSYQAIITQRYHGIILAELARVPYVSIHHHDKLKTSYIREGEFIPYFGFIKTRLFDALDRATHRNLPHVLPISPNVFSELTERVKTIIGRT